MPNVQLNEPFMRGHYTWINGKAYRLHTREHFAPTLYLMPNDLVYVRTMAGVVKARITGYQLERLRFVSGSRLLVTVKVTSKSNLVYPAGLEWDFPAGIVYHREMLKLHRNGKVSILTHNTVFWERS